jgi:hypothetical protein
MTTTTTTKATKTINPCYCGCGGTTKSKFVPGHDARFHGTVKKVVRGELDAAPILAALPHDDARNAFIDYAEKIEPVEAAKKAKEAADKAAKLAKKATPVVAPQETVSADQTLVA